MSSQEDYLDELLKDLSRELEELEVEQRGLSAATPEGESGMEEIDLSALMPETETSEEAKIPEEPELSLSQDESDLLETLGGLEEAGSLGTPEEPVISEEPELSLSQDESDLLETLGGLEEAGSLETPEELVIPEEPELSLSQDESDLLETLGGLEEAGSLGTPEELVIPEEPVISEEPELSLSQDESDLLETLGGLEEAGSLETPEELVIPEEPVISEEPELSFPQDDADVVGISEISSMSEEEIEQLLAAGREMSEDDNENVSGDLGGDIVDILADSDDSELKEIKDLLEKSDNNEAVGDEITSLLQGVGQEESLIPTDLLDPDKAADGAGEQLSPKQQKALEKKRLKEEAAAAKKAKKEAKKAEKKAKKTRKQDEVALDADALEGVDVVAEELVDTSLLDSILSEAGKIGGDEATTGLTGHHNAKVEGDLQDQLGEEVDLLGLGNGKDDESSVENAEDLGLDLDSLFGNSDGAEALVAIDGEESEIPDFVELDADDVAGIAELTGEDEDKPKKRGFFARFLDLLMQEDEEEESENEDIQLSEENQNIINDLDKEKNKKQAKEKKSKKKAKKAEASTEEGEEGGEGNDKKGKKKKEKKPKKEKPPKEVELVDPRKQLTLKKMMPIILFCLSLGLAIILLTNISVDFTDKKTAREAYYNGDYQTCYQNLFGKELNESDQVMFGKSESILIIRLWIREYEIFAEEGASLEALDCLIQAVNDYPSLYENASQWNAAGDVAVEYAIILNLLYENYGLTEEQARAIAAEPNDIEYTRQVNTIVQGGTYGSWNQPEPVQDAPLSDVLPEESELPDGNFIDTNTSAR